MILFVKDVQAFFLILEIKEKTKQQYKISFFLTTGVNLFFNHTLITGMNRRET